jgi:Fur family peroxide stress response transcriptional regulator
VDPQAGFGELVHRLREREYRLTPRCVALLRLLAASDGHPSASHLYDQIKDHFPTTSLATVYETLNVLEEIDEVLASGLSDGDNRYDGSKPYPHPHLVCINCRKTLDAKVSLAPNSGQEVAHSSGYQIVSHRLACCELCPGCQNGA